MTWFKRISFFILVNIAIMTMLTIIINLFGLEPYANQHGLNYQSLMIFCLIWGMGGSFISLFISKWMAKTMYRIKPLTAQDPQYGWIVQTVHRMAKDSGITKMPDVGVYDSQDINAFATGPSKNNSLVAVSSGLVTRMNRDAVEGVLGHEVAHIANGDMVTMTLLQGVMNAFVMFFARIAAHLIDNLLKDSEGRGGLGFFGHFAVVTVLQIIFGLLAGLVTSYFSRYREFRADAGGAALAGKNKMREALVALKNNYDRMMDQQKNGGRNQPDSEDQNTTIAAFKISNKSSWLELLSTHPSLDKRIAALDRFTFAR